MSENQLRQEARDLLRQSGQKTRRYYLVLILLTILFLTTLLLSR